jgi:hypothetical protein
MKGHRLEDTEMGKIPQPEDSASHALPPAGSYWRVLNRKTGEPMDVVRNFEDRRWWGSIIEDKWRGNLTGGVWGIITPLGQYAMLSIHTVREEDDGTISVRPGDGSSNSIKVEGPEGTWHGYIEHGEWSEV